MNFPKNQHWNPKVYLQYFTIPETRDKNVQKTWIFFKEEDENLLINEPIEKNIDKICTKKYLYSPVDKKGERDFSLESKFDSLETLIGQIWQKVAEDFVDFANNRSLRKIVALFISTMYLRNLDTLTQITDLHRQMVDFFSAINPR
ncbi:MAG: DUF4238 domain-containing protein [Cyanobacteria bacterium P01_A01_bin.40]